MNGDIVSQTGRDVKALTARECAELLRVSMPVMYRILSRRDFPSIKVGAKWLVNAGRLQDWLDEVTKCG